MARPALGLGRLVAVERRTVIVIQIDLVGYDLILLGTQRAVDLPYPRFEIALFLGVISGIIPAAVHARLGKIFHLVANIESGVGRRGTVRNVGNIVGRIVRFPHNRVDRTIVGQRGRNMRSRLRRLFRRDRRRIMLVTPRRGRSGVGIGPLPHRRARRAAATRNCPPARHRYGRHTRL